MTVHLVRLAVGAASLESLTNFMRRAARPQVCVHTRMTPRRKAELLDGGSLYWVVKGAIRGRQTLLAIDTIVDEEGARRCRLTLEGAVMATVPQPSRPFQGWRYLAAEDAPDDLGDGASLRGAGEAPAAMRTDLEELGLLPRAR